MTASACVAPGDPGSDAGLADEVARAKAPEALWAAFSDQQPHAFIVALAGSIDDAHPAWSAHKQRLLAPAELVNLHTWDELPLVHVQAANAAAASALLADEAVLAAYEDTPYTTTDAESFPLIDQPAAIAAGKSGAGTSVAILDTGTNYQLAAFGACTSPGVPVATCKVAFAKDFAPDDGALDANGHGTNVAGIALGVAPGTRILALDVFNGATAWSTDIISAINWTIANRATYQIAAMNLSLGGSSSTTPCTTDAMGIALGVARTAGIAPVVASGNGGLTNAISSPGCAPAAISVGAVYDSNLGGIGYSTCSDATTAADKIACFSNSASFLTLLAPGALITAAGITMAGTSQATPHVTGAIAILRAAFPAETVDQTVARLISTGKHLVDPRNSVTTSRIDVFAALASADTTSPTGTVALSPAAPAVNKPAVVLAITGSDPSGVAKMCISNTTTCTTFVPFASTSAWTLPTGDGTKLVTVFLRDGANNTTTATTSPTTSIRLDTIAPTGGVVSATGAVAQITVTWTAAADVTSGVASYRLVGNAGTALPAAGCSGAPIYAGTARSFTHTVAAKATWTYRLCAIDLAGNVSAGSTVTRAAM